MTKDAALLTKHTQRTAAWSGQSFHLGRTRYSMHQFLLSGGCQSSATLLTSSVSGLMLLLLLLTGCLAVWAASSRPNAYSVWMLQSSSHACGRSAQGRERLE
jgi:hypothetical protein